ncbi:MULTISPECIES: N-acetylmuramidase domain-containing protein [Paraburkholderia]|uniref:Peptidoglycan binding-like domain-containing protein n=1 Tax=Paraburkholderia fynbosensis TaxID=1200993 RepID=A0A6J5GLN9_9BURK|nr:MULTISPECIES: N-acetylmuramidase domain-containing protein [Paraburkholderia]CAB3801366.1 hypothetical protein LMG27177_05039 [Paraburkholderia fynbosensis]
MNSMFVGKGSPLTQNGFDTVLSALDVDASSLWALVTVETRGFGFLADRRPKILFERHVFHNRTGGRFSASNPDISSSTPGGYSGGAAEYDRLARAMQLDRQAALESASWGLPQLMGFNASKLGYTNVDGMVQAFVVDEDAQLDGARRFIASNAPLASAFRQKVWPRVAFFYNGKDYKKNAYDDKLLHYQQLYGIKGLPSIELRTAQAILTYLGFDTHGVDGVIGNGTRTAIIAFQRAKGLNVSAELDDATLDALKSAAP